MSILNLQNLNLTLPHKTCFEDFSSIVQPGSRVSIIGRNGSGKSSLLKIIYGVATPTSGTVIRPKGTSVGYVPQIVDDYQTLSGGERFNKALTQQLAQDPDILLLDEPTNHLDRRNRSSLMRKLKHFSGTLMVATHDLELLRHCTDVLWHIDNGVIKIFSGNYDDYMREARIKRNHIETELATLKSQKNQQHSALMKEQERASKKKAYGEKKFSDDKLALQGARRQGQVTHGKNRKDIRDKHDSLLEQLSNLRVPEIIAPKFSISAQDVGQKMLFSIENGRVGYKDKPYVLRGISLSVGSCDRVAILGDNGTGKSTLLKALKGDPNIIKENIPSLHDFGYLDQHYASLDHESSVFDTIKDTRPDWLDRDIRKHLNDFLFRKNEDILAKVNQLSGGEKARLCLAAIAAKTPKLLLLDEVTNNIDLETRQHIIDVLNAYPGSIIVISHDADFLDAIHITHQLKIP